jgi:uncharacterized protein YeeX (DUF496 family)
MESMQKWVDDSNKRIEDYIKNSPEIAKLRESLKNEINALNKKERS